MNEKFHIEKPVYIRKGQQLFNFLEWVRIKKGQSITDLGGRMADPYHIPDVEFDSLYEEFLEIQVTK